MDEQALARAAAREGAKKAAGIIYDFRNVDPMDTSMLPPLKTAPLLPAELEPTKGR